MLRTCSSGPLASAAEGTHARSCGWHAAVPSAAAAAAALPGRRCQAVAPSHSQAGADSHRPRGALVLRSTLDGLVDAFVRVHVGEVLDHLGLRAVCMRRACVRCPHTVHTRRACPHAVYTRYACGVPCAGPSAGRVSRPGQPTLAASPTVEEARPRPGGSGWAPSASPGAPPAPPTRPPAARCPPVTPTPSGFVEPPRAVTRRPEEAQAGTRAKGGGEGRLRMPSHCALRVAISRDALDRVGRRLANGRSELDAEHLHAAWCAWKRAVSSKVGV